MTFHGRVDIQKHLAKHSPNHPFAHEQISFVPTRSHSETGLSENTSKESSSLGEHMTKKLPVKFLLRIKSILRESEGSGSFTEVTALPDGTTATYTFPHAVGMAWFVRSGSYGAKFGPIPKWALTCHPYHRACLCTLALDWHTELPDERPEPSSDDEARIARMRELDNRARERSQTRKRKPNPVSDAIRSAVLRASKLEGAKKPFHLYGRGHEPRVTLDRSLAQVLREMDIPSVKFSRYGPKKEYPLRVFQRAAKILRTKQGLALTGYWET